MKPNLEYIGYSQIENLLSQYTALRALLDNLKIETNRIYREHKTGQYTEDDILYSMAVGNHVLTDMPAAYGASPGDKELRIIHAKDKLMAEMMGDNLNDINVIGETLDMLTGALMMLPAEDRRILTGKYCENMTWKQIAIELCAERETLIKKRRAAIERLQTVLRVTADQYDHCIKMIEDNKNRKPPKAL